MKIAHLTSVHPIDDVRIFAKQCTSLAANGFDVTLIACGDTEFEDTKNGVKRISLKVPVKSRLQRMRKRSKAVLKKALEIDANFYHFHDPELIPVGIRLKKLGKKVIFDSHENTAAVIRSRYWIPIGLRNILSSMYESYERTNIKYFDAIITVTPQLVDKFKASNQNTFLITNFPVLSTETDKTLDIPGSRKNLAFAGGVSKAYMFENVIEALHHTHDARLTIAGKAHNTKYFNKLRELKGWDKVNHIGVIPHDEVKSLYCKSLIGIACLGYTPNVGYKQGSLGVIKLFEFMQGGMAVICTDFDIWKNIVEGEQCGICVNPYNVSEIRDAIQYLVDNQKIAEEMGMNGKNAIREKYNWKSEEVKLTNIYNQLLRD